MVLTALSSQQKAEKMSIFKTTFQRDLVFYHPDRITLKKQLLTFIAKQIEQINPALKHQHVLSALHQRERIGHTVITTGVAIPHARIAKLDAPIGVITALHSPIYFDSHKTLSVSLVFTLLVPEKATDTHLTLLKELSLMLKQPHNLNQLITSSSADDLWTKLITLIP